MARTWNPPGRPTADEWMNAVWSVHAVGYQSPKGKGRRFDTRCHEMTRSSVDEASQKRARSGTPFMGSDQNRQVRRDRTRSVVAGGFREGGMGGDG